MDVRLIDFGDCASRASDLVDALQCAIDTYGDLPVFTKLEFGESPIDVGIRPIEYEPETIRQSTIGSDLYSYPERIVI
jgi:hypothetical protein